MSASSRITRKHLLVIVASACTIKLISLAFLRLTVGPNLLSQLSTRWDSAYYVNIAMIGYPAGGISANYAFAPGYPTLIRLMNLFAGNYLLSAALISNFFSVLAVVVLYHIAKIYFSSTESLYASLAFLLFPTFVTYGLVSYSEPVYITFAMLAVYFFLKRRYFYFGITSSVAVLCSFINILIPIVFLSIILLSSFIPRLFGGKVLDSFSKGTEVLPKFGLAWLAAPLLTLGIWMYFLDVRSGIQNALFVAQGPWGVALANPIAQLQSFFTGVLSKQGNPVQQLLMRYVYTLPFLALVYPLWKVDRGLALYSFTFMLFVLSLVGVAYASGPRLMLSAWPITLVFGKLEKEYAFTVLVLFALVSLSSTYAQMTMFWT